jgi:hypothetical protein
MKKTAAPAARTKNTAAALHAAEKASRMKQK